MTVASNGDLSFLHGFKQRGLDLGRCAVDLICQNQVAKQRPRLEADFIATLDLMQDLGTSDI
ncbi:hypothetical protein D3C85_1942500 [compost metagenome]